MGDLCSWRPIPVHGAMCHYWTRSNLYLLVCRAYAWRRRPTVGECNACSHGCSVTVLLNNCTCLFHWPEAVRCLNGLALSSRHSHHLAHNHVISLHMLRASYCFSPASLLPSSELNSDLILLCKKSFRSQTCDGACTEKNVAEERMLLVSFSALRKQHWSPVESSSTDTKGYNNAHCTYIPLTAFTRRLFTLVSL